MKQGSDLVRVKASLNRMPLGVKFAFILVAALLLPGVTPKSILRSVETTGAPSPSVVEGPKADKPEKEAAVEKNDLESNVMGTASSEEADSLKYDETENAVLAEKEKKPKVEEIYEEIANSFNDYTNPGAAEGENLTGVDDDNGISEADIAEAAEAINFIVKRASEARDKAGDPQASFLDVDNFQFSDFSEIIEPLVRAFSSSPESEAPEAPSEEDFFFWFPAIKKFLEFTMENAAKPAGTPASSTTTSAGSSGSLTSSEPSRQIAPASTQPVVPDVLPPTLQDVFVTPELPTIAGDLLPVQPSLSDVPDSEESSSESITAARFKEERPPSGEDKTSIFQPFFRPKSPCGTSVWLAIIHHLNILQLPVFHLCGNLTVLWFQFQRHHNMWSPPNLESVQPLGPLVPVAPWPPLPEWPEKPPGNSSTTATTTASDAHEDDDNDNDD
ncbi:hypothetical protein lerEdw1_010553 [Lerista edwardsae]|nr:hypothetical protein lerEdw1_010553 [Lerista edwardsae]